MEVLPGELRPSMGLPIFSDSDAQSSVTWLSGVSDRHGVPGAPAFVEDLIAWGAVAIALEGALLRPLAGG